MKKHVLFKLSLTFLLALFFSVGWVNGQQTLIISEVADPGDDYNGRFVELYNATDAEIDFGVSSFYLVRQANGGSFASVELTGTIVSGGTFIIANNATNFESIYGFAPEMASGIVTGNGDDGYFLYADGDDQTGTLFDAYGVIDIDGTGEAWEYVDSRAVRVATVGAANTTWTASEWTITAADVADMIPGEHTCDYPEITDTPDWYNLQWPENGAIDFNGTFTVYAQVFEPGVTDAVGQGAGIEAWIGVSTEDTDPSTWTTWISATYNQDVGNNDEYMAEIGSSLDPGTYYYASRFSLNGGPYVYGGFDGGAWDGITNVSGELQVGYDTDSYADATGVTQPTGAAISSLDWDVLTPTATPVFQFNIADAGTADGLPTQVTEITIKAGTNNTADWTQDIGGGYLYKESSGTQLSIVTEPDVQTGQVTFYIEDGELDVTDGGSELITLYIWPDETITDNAVIECMIDAANHGFAADPAGSVFADDFGTDVTGNQFTFNVEATQLSFITQPTNVYVGQTMPPVEVATTDINGNVDVDYADTEINLAFLATGTMSGTTAVTTTLGVAAFTDLSFDTEEAGVTLNANGGPFAQAESNTFDITTPPVVSLPYTRDFETGDINTDGWSTQVVIGTLDWYIDEFSGNKFAKMSNYSGGNQLSETWLITPGIDLSTAVSPVFSFMNACNFNGADIEVKISTDYDGFSAPSTATWTDLSPTLSTGGYDNVYSGELDLSAYTGGTAYIAFKYTGTDSDGKTWQIDDVSIALSDDATLSAFTLGGEDVTGLTGLEVADPVNDAGATLYVDDITGFAGIVIDATNSAATVTVELNGSVVDPGNYAAQALADGDVVLATVEAEDGTMAYYKVTVIEENRVLEITGPTLPATYETGDDIIFTWTATNIDTVNIYVVDTEANLVNEEGVIDATLSTYTYTVANGDFGTFTIRITDASDETFFVETTGEITVIDTLHPEGIEFYPAMGAVDVPLSFTLSVLFDEEVVAGTGNFTIYDAFDNSQVLNFTEADFTINEDELMLSVTGLEFDTEYYILADTGIIEDLSGNATPVLDDPTEWTFTTMVEPESDLFFSEYIEGSGNNKALEIFNPTASDVDLSNYVIRINANGGDWTSIFEFPVGTILPSEDVYVIAHEEADAAILAETDTVVVNPYGGGESYVAVFNGNDVRALCKVEGTDTTIIDIIGRYDGVDPGEGWAVAGVNNATKDHTLVRKSSIIVGNPDWDSSAGTNETDSEWIVYEQNYFENIGTHSIGLNSEAEILDFTFGLAIDYEDAVIESGTATVDITVINGTDVTALAPTISISDYATINPESGDTLDFTNPVIYTVTAQDGVTTKDWTVTVTELAELSDKANILEVQLAGVDSININDTETTVTIYAPYGFDVTSVKPEFTVSAGASIVDTATARDFTDPQIYEVTAQDGSTIKNWEVAIDVQEAIEVADIASLRELYSTTNDNIYKITGEVTLTYATDPNFYIQDATAAILIYNGNDAITTAYEIGDNIQNIIGQFDSFGGNMQFALVVDPGAAISSGNTITPQVVTISELASNYDTYDAELIKFENVTIKETGVFEGGENYTIVSGSDEVILRTNFANADYIGENIPEETLDITALAGIYYGDAQVYPRSLNDIVVVTGINNPDGIVSMNVYPNPSNGHFTFEMNASKAGTFKVEIINIQGQVVYQKQITQDGFYRESIDISDKARGMYYIRLNDGQSMKIAKIMIQ